jgi:hypothetical protein
MPKFVHHCTKNENNLHANSGESRKPETLRFEHFDEICYGNEIQDACKSFVSIVASGLTVDMICVSANVYWLAQFRRNH